MIEKLGIIKGKRGIFFDIGYTLCRMKTGDWWLTNKFYEHIPRKYMEQVPPSVLLRMNEAGVAIQREYPFVRSLDEEYRMDVEVYRAMIRELPEISVTDGQLRDIAADRLNNMENYYFYDGLREVFSELHGRYRIGIISDTWPSADRVLKRAGIYDWIDSFTYSCYLGVTKPHPAMYRHALQDLGLPGRETVFIDDSVQNLEGAAAEGIEPVLILTTEQKGRSRFHEIEKIKDVLDLF